VLIEALVWTVVVEMALVDAEHGTGVALVVDQHPVGALSPDASNEPLRITVRAGRLGRNLDDLDVLGGEHRVERSGELRVSVTDQEPKPGDPIIEVGDQIAGLLGGPLGRRMGRDALRGSKTPSPWLTWSSLKERGRVKPRTWGCLWLFAGFPGQVQGRRW
jgi:hypothetical protein